MNPRWCAGFAFVVLTLAGCSSPKHYAPVEDHSAAGRAVGTAVSVVAAEPPREIKPPPSVENAGRTGYYTVKPGDTLIRIGLETGQSWKDLSKWNNLDKPNVIEVGQVLRIVPPGTDATVAGTKPIVPSKVETRPLDVRGAVLAAAAEASPPAPPVPPASAAVATVPSVPFPPSAPASARDAEDNINWMWPAGGPVVASFDGNRRKGLGIGGKPGDPVFAAADARVVYAGSGLRGYGNLVILKHNNTYLTAYAHNQTLLVKEDQAVRRGQKIAEMGATDSDKVQLDFEIRKLGKPIDPAKLLPPR